MESALHKFLTLRQRYCKNVLGLVSVENLGGGAINDCFGNAHNQLREGVAIVSGWLAEPRQHSPAQRQFTQHWWNFDDRNREHFDTTPEIEKEAVYILDSDIALFAAHNNTRLSSCVSRSVIYWSGGFFTMEYAANGYDLRPASDLSTERLFAALLQPEPHISLQQAQPQVNLSAPLTH